jgi:hypothetical protein
MVSSQEHVYSAYYFYSPILGPNFIPDKNNILHLLFQFQDLVLEKMLSLFPVKQGNCKAIQ